MALETANADTVGIVSMEDDLRTGVFELTKARWNETAYGVHMLNEASNTRYDTEPGQKSEFGALPQDREYTGRFPTEPLSHPITPVSTQHHHKAQHANLLLSTSNTPSPSPSHSASPAAPHSPASPAAAH